MSGTKTCTGAKLRDDPIRVEAFMRALGETASPRRACIAAGVSSNVAYALRRVDTRLRRPVGRAGRDGHGEPDQGELPQGG